MKVLVFGEILWDIIDGTPHLGGAPLNFAAHVRKCGGESEIVSCLGLDEFGNEALRRIKSLGFEGNMIQRSSKKTGTVPVTLKNGQPQYDILDDVAFDYIERDKLDSDLIKNYDSFYFGSLIQRNKISENALLTILENNHFTDVFYDVNLRKNCYSVDIIKRSLEFCSILKVNDAEVAEISNLIWNEKLEFDSFCQAVSERNKNIKIIIITAGEKGCFVYQNKTISMIPALDIEVKDTVGAGDSFSAAFLTQYAFTNDALKSAEIANRVGGFVASQAGAIPEYSLNLLEDLSK